MIPLRGDELDRLRLHAFVTELEDQVGPVDETEVVRYGALPPHHVLGCPVRGVECARQPQHLR